MIDAGALIAEAETRARVVDGDTFVRANLEKLTSELQCTFPMSTEGEQSVRSGLLRDAVNRLEGLRWLQNNPEIADEEIAAPLFLMGLPRSGTTYLQYLFDRDHRFRLIRTWQSVMPSPPPGSDPASVASRQAAFADLQRRKPHFDGFEALHLYDDDGSDECHAFLEQSYGAAGLNNLYRVPGYFDYLLDEADLAETYRVHRRQLQLLQWRRPVKPWALKYPNHVIALPEICEVFPDARMVMTHRDPVQVVASISKMTFNLRSMRSASAVDKCQVGQDMLHFISRHIERIMAFDESDDGRRIVHVDYYSLMANPVAGMMDIHRSIGIDTPPSVREAVQRWHDDNPKNARGSNDYALEEYGLCRDDLEQRFARYRQRFEIPREREGLLLSS